MTHRIHTMGCCVKSDSLHAGRWWAALQKMGELSRICVKNVPKHVDERRLNQHFGSQGRVTDAKLLRTKDGASRRMAFIGYKTAAEAKDAVEYFNGTFLDTSRLLVEIARPKGDADLPRPWSRYSEGSSRHAEKTTKADAKGGVSGEKAGAELVKPGGTGGGDSKAAEEEGKETGKEGKGRRVKKEDFLAAMMPRSTTKFWANDEAGFATQPTPGADAAAQDAGSGGDEGSGTEGEEEPCSTEEGEGESVEDAEHSIAVESSAKSRPLSSAASGLDWLRSKVKKGLEKEVLQRDDEDEMEGAADAKDAEDANGSARDDDGDESEGDDDEEEEEDGEGQEGVPELSNADGGGDGDGDEAEDGDGAEKMDAGGGGRAESDGAEGEGDFDVRATGRLFLRNLPFSTTEDDLMEELGRFGHVSEVHIPLDDAKRPKGFAFAQFLLPEDAHKAMAALNGKPFQGRLLHVIPAKEPPKDPLAELDPSKARTYKERKEIERRRKAADDKGWNASILRSDTVVDAVADRLGLAKGAVLDRDVGDMAVRLALGETYLLAENREFFEKEGVDLSALGGKARKRSNTTILVKNLPYTTSQDDLTKLFGRFGSLSRLLLPPSRAIGLVDFLEPSDARRAFKGLAYKRFQHVPLYLEWAPLGTLAKSKPDAAAAETPAGAPAPPPTTGADVDDGLTAEEEGSFTLYVKNLNFDTSEQALAEAFKKRTKGVRAVSLPKKTVTATKGGKQQPQTLSLGFGFVEYQSPTAAREAVKIMNGALLDGHKLECKISEKRLTAPRGLPGGKSAQKKTKLVVRNLAFQATIKEVRELFGSFGKIKTVRIPKKFDGSHRGFAFVEFLTAQEAANAYKALSSTHLYGRHLVLEWAEEGNDQDMDVLRGKAAKDVSKTRVSSTEGLARGAKKARTGGDEDDMDFD